LSDIYLNCFNVKERKRDRGMTIIRINEIDGRNTGADRKGDNISEYT
jgi:hypothetical protein